MIKKDWEERKKKFLEMLENAEKNKKAALENIEELNVFIDAIDLQIATSPKK